MAIGPISAIRPVSMIKPSSTAPDLSGVFEAEYLGQSSDDEYTPANRTAVQGSVEEEEMAEADIAMDDESPQPASGSVSLFA